MLSIASKLNVASLLILTTTIFTVALLSNAVSGNMIIQKTTTSSEQTLETIARSLDVLFSHAEDLAKIAIANDRVQALLQQSDRLDPQAAFEREFEVRTFLDTVIEPRNTVSSMVLYGRDQVLAASVFIKSSEAARSTIPSEGTLSMVKRPLEKMTWVGFHPVPYETDHPGSCVSLVRPIFDLRNYTNVGVLETNIAEKTITSIYSQIQYGKTGRFFFLDENGTVVSSSHADEIGTVVAGTAPGSRILLEEGRNRLVTALFYPRFGWTLVGSVPLDELLADTNWVTILIFLAGLACLLPGMAVSYLVSRSITRPLARLSRLMAAAGQGDLEVRAEPRGSDEVSVLGVSFNAMIGQISNLLEKIEGEQRQKQEYELAALQAQINPHFLYNTLESVCSLAQLKRNDDLFDMVKALARFYRSTLGDGRSLISLREEVELVHHYLVIQKIRYGEKLNFTFAVDDAVLEAPLLKLTLQPLVENALYHGLRAKPGAGHITVEARVEGDDVLLSVTDDGVGYDEVNDGLPHFGLSSIHDRLRLAYGDRYGLRLFSKPGQGTRVEILIPSGPVS